MESETPFLNHRKREKVLTSSMLHPPCMTYWICARDGAKSYRIEGASTRWVHESSSRHILEKRRLPGGVLLLPLPPSR